LPGYFNRRLLLFAHGWRVQFPLVSANGFMVSLRLHFGTKISGIIVCCVSYTPQMLPFYKGRFCLNLILLCFRLALAIMQTPFFLCPVLLSSLFSSAATPLASHQGIPPLRRRLILVRMHSRFLFAFASSHPIFVPPRSHLQRL